jgi:hypothetical protein
MESQQMMELLLKKSRAGQEEMRMNQAKTDAVLLAMQMMESSHREIVAEVKPEMDVMTKACQEMEERLEEEQPTSLDRKPEAAEQREVPVEDAKVMPIGELKKKRRRDQNQQKNE